MNWVVCLNFNYFGLILFFAVASLICIISYFTERPSESQTQGARCRSLVVLVSSSLDLKGLLSTLVHKEVQNGQNKDIQLTNVRYTSMQENEPQNSESGMKYEHVAVHKRRIVALVFL